MFLLILIGIGAATAAELEFYEAWDIRGINFGNAVIGRVLDVGVFLKVDMITEVDCAVKCASVLNCFSYNFYSLPQNESKNCELSDKVRFGYGMRDIPNSIHRGIKTACDDTSICRQHTNTYCKPNFYDNTHQCYCIHGYYRTVVPGTSECVPIPKTCSELFQRGINTSGIYLILPIGLYSFQVFCDMETDGGGWTMLQRRHDNKIHFNKDWNSYKNGFGDLNKSFWLGNSKIYRLTLSDQMVLRFDLEDFEGNKAFAEYQNVTVLAMENNFKLFFGEYSGTAGDSLRCHYGMNFTTTYKGGWWYNSCHKVNINGMYFQKGQHFNKIKGTGIMWYDWKNAQSLKTTEMKIRPKTHQ